MIKLLHTTEGQPSSPPSCALRIFYRRTIEKDHKVGTKETYLNSYDRPTVSEKTQLFFFIFSPRDAYDRILLPLKSSPQIYV